MIWIWMLCRGSARVSCSAGQQQGALLPSDSRDLCSPTLHRLDSRYSLLMPCPPCSSALLREGWEEAVRHWCPASVGENSQEVLNSGAAKRNLTLCAKGYQNALRMTQCTMTERQSEHKHNRSMERLPPAQACSQHERCHSTQPELGPGYKGLAARVLIHNASVNTFISLELHQGLEAEKTVTPNQNLAQRLNLWLFKSQHIPRTVNSSVLCSERRTPQKQKWNEERGSSATKVINWFGNRSGINDTQLLQGPPKHRPGEYHRQIQKAAISLSYQLWGFRWRLCPIWEITL